MDSPQANDVVNKLLLDIYNLKAASVTCLTGYDDINYAVEAKQCGTEECGKFILKIVNIADSTRVNLTESIMTVLQNITNIKLATPRPVKSRTGNLVELTSVGEATRKVVLLTYVPGLCYKELKLSQDNFLNLCSIIGSCAGALATELTRLSCITKPLPVRPDDIYMIENLHLSHNKLHMISSDIVKQISLQIMSIIENMPKTKLSLRKGLIHNDVCLENLIYSDTKVDKYEVKGIIDFSDMTYGYLVFDAAIPIASCMYQTYFMHDIPYLMPARLVLSEFERSFPLNLVEKDFLFYAVMARFISLRVLGGYDVLHSPETAQHEEHESQPLEYFIEKLWTAGKSEFDHQVFGQ